ncbi:MAG TPA: Tim44/TimA family putative adaptor protein [Novosphingobium sp.]|nr:Tim44/TimA family putative adaptor protein [Novosphingobium sp.]
MEKTVEIVIIAMVAAFLGLRLFSVLGRRAEHEEHSLPPRFEPKEPKADAPRGAVAELTGSGGAARPLVPGVTPAIERGMREIAAADRHFDMLAFIEGAKGAYRMALEAFWKGDREALAPLCDADVREAFGAAIDAREAAGETLDYKLVRIEDANIVAAEYRSGVARITVRFTADIAAVTRNAEGQVIAGSLNDAVEACDLWTFSRSVSSASPDWLIDETDEG